MMAYHVRFVFHFVYSRVHPTHTLARNLTVWTLAVARPTVAPPEQEKEARSQGGEGGAARGDGRGEGRSSQGRGGGRAGGQGARGGGRQQKHKLFRHASMHRDTERL